jgi:molybdopterin converting factor small subunit
MKVRVQFFSHLKDLASQSELEMDLGESAKVSDLLGELYTRFPQLRAWDSSILIGAGVEFVERDHLLRPDEEIAIMPPVQGG